MARIPLEHDKLYFDVLIRTQKAESLLALINASYFAYKNQTNIADVKEEIAKRLKSAYELYRDNIRGSDSGAGTYSGSESQFESQYTIGHEMAIWNDSSLSLTFLANKVAVGELAVKDYITNIFLSYLQPIDGKMIHPLYMILDYMEKNQIRYIEKSNFEDALKVQCSTEQCNSLFNYLINVNYFDYSGNKIYLKKEFEIIEIKDKCNKLFLKESYDNIIKTLSDSDIYESYLIKPYFDNDLKLPNEVNYTILSKQFQLWLLSNLNPNKKDNSNFNGYSHNLFKIVSYLESNKKVLNNSMFKNNVEYYDFILLKYENDTEAKEIDKKQHYPARAALPLYKIFISQINKYGYNKIEEAIKQNLYVTDLSYEIKLEEQNYWLCSANAAIYDHDSALHTNGFIDWAQDKHFKKANVGDIVFIYSTSPTKRVKYKCKITKKDISKENKISDVQYWTNSIQDEEYKGSYIRFKLLKESDDRRLIYDNLLKMGLKSAPQGAMKLDDEYLSLAHYIDDIFEEDNIQTIKQNPSMTEYQYKSSIQNGENKVVYGTPGCGKSYYVQNTLLKGYLEENVIRTTFYQDYTNTDFVGQILPVIESDKSVSYEFIPGPFSIALAKALEKPEEQVALVVEELNRGNAASIFGDIFQLLDREIKGENKGRSVYSITNVNLQKHLTKELKFIFNKIMIPSNLSIYATMNTSDQNVFTLDTAFKRRWKFEKLSNKFEDYNKLYSDVHPFKDDFIPGMLKTWENFVYAINNAILKEADIPKSEDKQLGIFFVDESGLVKKELVDVVNKVVNDELKKEKAKEFAYKIFEYLWDDVLKYCHDNWFGKEIKSLDDLIKEYIEKAETNKGDEVFVNDIFKNNQ